MKKEKASEDKQVGGIEVIRDLPPTHFTFKVNSYSLLSKTLIQRYESSDFEAGGYQWKLAFYPNGNKEEEVKDHISLYLVFSETNKLPPGWEVNAAFKFFLFDQKHDKYLAIEDIGGTLRRFYAMKTERGYSELIPLKTFNDPSNGYLVNDTCVFGAEVFVCKNTGKLECLSMLKEINVAKFSWKIERFPALGADSRYSPVFSTGNHPWKIEIYPCGYSMARGTSLSVFLTLDNSFTFSPGQKLYAEYKLCVVNENNGKHIEKSTSHWFTHSSRSYGFPNFIELDTLKHPDNGFLVNDTIIIEADVNVLATAT